MRTPSLAMVAIFSLLGIIQLVAAGLRFETTGEIGARVMVSAVAGAVFLGIGLLLQQRRRVGLLADARVESRRAPDATPREGIPQIRLAWSKRPPAKLHLVNPPARLDGELQAEIELPAGVAPTGAVTAFLWCEERRCVLLGSRHDGDAPELQVTPLVDRRAHFVLDDARRQEGDRTFLSVRIPLSGGMASRGVAEPTREGESGVVWVFELQFPLNRERYGASFHVPVAGAAG